MQKTFRLCLYLSFLHLKPRRHVLKFEFFRLSWVEPRKNLHLFGKM